MGGSNTKLGRTQLIESRPSSSSYDEVRPYQDRPSQNPSPARPEYFKEALERILKIHDSKAHDYTDNREFGNFEDAARASGVTVAQAIEVLIGTKEARRQNLEHNTVVTNNEPIEDTLLDRAVYCIIRYAYHLYLQDNGVDRRDLY